jgi:hypothetical protein
MKVTKENAIEIAQKMSEELDGGVLSICTHPADYKVEHRYDENGLDKKGWLGDAAKQTLPVKTSDIQLLWSTGHYSYSLPYSEDHDIVFPRPGVVSILQKAMSGATINWTFIKS